MSFTHLFTMSNAIANSFHSLVFFYVIIHLSPLKVLEKKMISGESYSQVKLMFAPTCLYCMCFHPILIYSSSDIDICSRLLVSHPSTLYLLASDGETQGFHRTAVHLSQLTWTDDIVQCSELSKFKKLQEAWRLNFLNQVQVLYLNSTKFLRCFVPKLNPEDKAQCVVTDATCVMTWWHGVLTKRRTQHLGSDLHRILFFIN